MREPASFWRIILLILIILLGVVLAGIGFALLRNFGLGMAGISVTVTGLLAYTRFIFPGFIKKPLPFWLGVFVYGALVLLLVTMTLSPSLGIILILMWMGSIGLLAAGTQ